MRSNWMRLQSYYRWVGILGVIIACLLAGCGSEGHAAQPPQKGSMIYVLSTGETNASNPSSDARTSIAALRASDGAILWQHHEDKLISELQAGAGVVYISAAIPGLPNADTSIRALRSYDGTLLWQREFNRSILAAPLSITNEAAYVDLVNDDYATPPPQQVHLSVLQASN